MSRVRRVAAAAWRFLDRIGWVIAILFVGVALWRVHGDEAHTRAVQKAGEPVGVCLLDMLEAVKPLLLRVSTVEEPLDRSKPTRACRANATRRRLVRRGRG
jgi:hypothetical protein